MAKGDVKIAILGDATSAKRAFKETDDAADKFSRGVKSGMGDATKHADGFTKSMGGVSSGLGKIAAFVGGAAVVGFFKGSIDAASDLTETLSKIGVVFGSAKDRVIEMGETSATALRMSKNEALEAAGNYGNLFRAIGLTEDASADMSVKLVGLAADLASFNNADPSDVLAALRSGLVGETEPLRIFGVSLSAARIQAEALRTGLVKGNVNLADVETATVKVAKANRAAAEAAKEHGYGSLQYRDATAKVTQAEEDLADKMAGKVPDLDAAAKAQAAYTLIMQDTALAQGDAARTADTVAGRTAASKARFEDLKLAIGEGLMPIYVGAMDLMVVASDKVKSWWDENGPGIKTKFEETFGRDPVDNFKKGLEELGIAMDDNGVKSDSLWANFERGGVVVYGTIGPALDWLKQSVLDPLWGSLQAVWDKANDVWDFLTNTPTGPTSGKVGKTSDAFKIKPQTHLGGGIYPVGTQQWWEKIPQSIPTLHPGASATPKPMVGGGMGEGSAANGITIQVDARGAVLPDSDAFAASLVKTLRPHLRSVSG